VQNCRDLRSVDGYLRRVKSESVLHSLAPAKLRLRPRGEVAGWKYRTPKQHQTVERAKNGGMEANEAWQARQLLDADT